MVIHQFNKLIRNKWVWGVFAVAVSLAFCCEDLFTKSGPDERVKVGSAGKLAGEDVDAKVFSSFADDVRGFGRNRDTSTHYAETNRRAWETLAAVKVAERNGIASTDAEIVDAIRNDRSFAANGGFNYNLYRAALMQNGLNEERFEQFMKRRLTLNRIATAMIGASTWASPAEVEQLVWDATDRFSVRVVRFAQDKKDADAIKLDDAGLRKWYDANTNRLALPERVRIRYVKYDAKAPETLAKMTVTEDDIRDRFDVTADKYVITGTNGVEETKKFEQLTKEERDGIEKDLRVMEALQYFETNLNRRIYAEKAAKGSSRLDEIAKEDGAKIETSDWFSTDGRYQEGFMSYASTILPGAKDFIAAVAELDPELEDCRYGVVLSDSAVWMIEKAEVSPAHTPTFEEAKGHVDARALRDAKADAFKAQVEAVIAKGVAELAKCKDISTNLTFSAMSLESGAFPDQAKVVAASKKLRKGEVSEFTLTRPGNALVVICDDRVPGDAAAALGLARQAREMVQMDQRRELSESWLSWNLNRMGAVTTDLSSMTESTEEIE